MKAAKKPRFENVAEMLEKLGNIPPVRVRLSPPPGAATEKDLRALLERSKQLTELVDGVLVEKPMGLAESILASELNGLLRVFVRQHDLGVLAGEAAPFRLMPALVRMPDVSFISWDRFPSRIIPRTTIAGLVPDLAVEVLGEANTKEEMARKVREYFFAGVRLVWIVDPAWHTVQVLTAPDQVVTLEGDQVLDGGAVLPGFSLPLRQLFAHVPPPRPRRKGKRKP